MKQFFSLAFVSLCLLYSSVVQARNYSSEIVLKKNWKIASSQKITSSGSEIASVGFDDANWISCSLPTTILNALVANGDYPDLYKADRLEKIDASQFEKSWWYRTEFNLSEKAGRYHIKLLGINYRANIYLNGKKIADADTLETAFRQFKIDVTSKLKKGCNALALEIIPPQKSELSIGFVDWNPTPADKNMGIWRDIELVRTGDVEIDGILVESKVDTETLNSADLTFYTWLQNHGNKKEVELSFEFEGVKFKHRVLLQKNERKKIVINSENHQELHIDQPRLWWPNGLGSAELYHLKLSLNDENTISDRKNIQFGIRTVDQFVNANGHKGYKINGKKVLIKGAGWVDDLLLGDSDQKVKDQLAYAKHMNLNTIRMEGFWAKNESFYNAADELGLLVMIGWSCHWEWEGYCHRKENKYMCITTPEEEEKHALGFRDQVKWLRNHPSVFLWVYGSDKLPNPRLEKRLNELVVAEDHTRPILASCKGNDFGTDNWNVSEISGPSGVKMLGPYGYVTPNYWYEDKKIGGAYGFNTETGPGPQVPPLESLKRMLPEDKLWPINQMWDYHCGRHEFQTLDRFLKAFNNRYGAAKSVEEFARYCQLSNYEAIRPMFEAFQTNKYEATGVVQWMLNSAWPEMFWQLYDWYMLPNAAFYGTKHACAPVNLIYNYHDRGIYIANEHFTAINNAKAKIRILNDHSQIVYDTIVNVDVEANTSRKILDFPKIDNLTNLYFLDLQLTKASKEQLADNFYWLSKKQDVCDYSKSEWFITPNKAYADFTSIKNLPQVSLDVATELDECGGDYEMKVQIKNPSQHIAFFIEMNIYNQSTQNSVLPVFWSDNYVSLLPGEQKVFTAKFRKSLISKDQIGFRFSGINIKK